MPKTKKLGSAKKEPKTNKDDYFLEVNIDGFEYKGSAKTLDQAILDFINNPARPYGVKSKVLFRFGKGSVESSRVFSAMQARRIFNQIELKSLASELLANKLINQLGE